MANKPVKIVETVLRDGHQSIAATRMRIVDMLPVLEKIDNAGYHAVEAWGGATFDSCQAVIFFPVKFVSLMTQNCFGDNLS